MGNPLEHIGYKLENEKQFYFFSPAPSSNEVGDIIKAHVGEISTDNSCDALYLVSKYDFEIVANKKFSPILEVYFKKI